MPKSRCLEHNLHVSYYCAGMQFALVSTKKLTPWRTNNLKGRFSSELMILRLAKENKGILTVSDVALGAGISMTEAKKHLDDMVARGFAELRTRKNGSQAYIIPDMLDGPLEGF